MKLVLASSGTQEIILDKVVELVGKPASEISVCMINEASNMNDSDVRFWIDSWQKVSDAFGGKLGACNLLALDINEIEKRLSQYDVVWCWGGNTDYLKSVFDKTGFSLLIPKLLKSKVWVGSSAGSCVLGKRQSFTLPLEYGITEYLGLFDFCIRPHIWEEYATEDKYKYESLVKESHKQKVYALSDGSAVVVDGGRIYLHGKKAQLLKDGKVVEEI